MKPFLFLEADDVIYPGDEVRMTCMPHDDGWGPAPKNLVDWEPVENKMPAYVGKTYGELLSRHKELGYHRSDGRPFYEVRRPFARTEGKS